VRQNAFWELAENPVRMGIDIASIAYYHACMRGDDQQPDSMFSYVSPEQRVPKNHPLRAIRQLVDEILRELSRDFDRLYATVGRPSIPPERLLRAQLLQIFYSIRSERLLMEQLDYNILFRWFVGLAMDDPIWNPTVFTKNRDRLLNQDLARDFLRRVVDRAAAYMSDDHFTVDGTLIEAWASQKRFQRTDGGPDRGGRNFHGESRTNDTHASTTDPDSNPGGARPTTGSRQNRKGRAWRGTRSRSGESICGGTI
jgi:transposase